MNFCLKENVMVLLNMLIKVKNSLPKGRIWWLKLHVAPNNGNQGIVEIFEQVIQYDMVWGSLRLKT
jgi:hypothetical protein